MGQTLTEASNLLAQHGEPERSRFFEVLRILIEENEEIVVTSKTASQNAEFNRLGLTDAGLLEVVSDSNPLITVDLALYLAATRKESGAAYSFSPTYSCRALHCKRRSGPIPRSELTTRVFSERRER